MFNVLSGLQEGSYSVPTVQRGVAPGNVFVKGSVVMTDNSGKFVPATGPANASEVEFIFEDLTGNSSKKYTAIFGNFEAETDIVDETAPAGAGEPGGAINPGDFLTPKNGKLAKASSENIAAKNYCAKVTGTAAASMDHALGTPLGKRVQFRTVRA